MRLLSSGVGLIILAVVLMFYETPIFVMVIGVLAVLAVFELLHSTGYVKNYFLLGWSLLFSFLLPGLFTFSVRPYFYLFAFVYVAGMFILLLIFHDRVQFESFAVAFMISVLIPSVFSFMIAFRNVYHGMGMYYLFLILMGAWGSDTGAYFVGRAFGKHKLSPQISPNKTVEGFIGGIVFATAGYFLTSWIFQLLVPVLYHQELVVDYPWLLLVGPFCSAAGVVGDLSASTIKRQTRIKDFGTIMPGHGGIMDRFDSVLFVSPVLFLLVRYLPFAHLGIS